MMKQPRRDGSEGKKHAAAVARPARVSGTTGKGKQHQPLRVVAEQAKLLRDVIGELSSQVLPGEARGRDWVYRLGLDKSLVSRVVRTLRSVDEGELVRQMPSNAGVRLVIEACVRAGAKPETSARALEALEGLERAIALMPGGRAGLRNALAGAGVSQRASMERESRRMMVQAMSMLSGMWVDTRYAVVALAKSVEPGALDVGMLTYLSGLHRARAETPVLLMQLAGKMPGDAVPTRTRLDGGVFDDDPLSCLLPEFSSNIAQSVTVERRGHNYNLLLGPSEPPLAKSLDVAMGVRYARAMADRRSEKQNFGCIQLVTRRATHRFVVDVLVERGALEGVPPRLIFSLDLSGVRDWINGPEPDGRETLQLDVTLEPMGSGFDRLGSEEADSFVPAGKATMERLGWDADRFDRYRLDLVYPIPQVCADFWFTMPERGGSEDAIKSP
jgi:hypothetical protein